LKGDSNDADRLVVLAVLRLLPFVPSFIVKDYLKGGVQPTFNVGDRFVSRFAELSGKFRYTLN
jgi:hypothetical protein